MSAAVVTNVVVRSGVSSTTTASVVGTTKKPLSLLRIGMIGGGTVGGGVYELINKYWSDRGIVIKKIGVNNINKERDFIINTTTTTITTDIQSIINDPNIDCIVEVMGGTTIAKDIVLTSIHNGKSVVTANKALLAEYLDEITEAVTSSSAIGMGIEASVCGGIPIINILQTTYVADTIQSIKGICNGTTNYMLSEMYNNGTNYNDVLKVAQQLGYAENDPTADVEGYDVRSKIAILAKLAFGQTIINPATSIPCKGISSISSVDIQYAKLYNYNIKLLGFAVGRQQSDGDDNETTTIVSVYVTPVLVPLSNMFASINGSGNCVAIQSQNMGSNTCYYTGPGAGRYPTANSVVNDIIHIYNNSNNGSNTVVPFPITSSLSKKTIKFDPNYTGTFYIRITKSNNTSWEEKDVSCIQEIATTSGIILDGNVIVSESVAYITTGPNIPVNTIESYTNTLLETFGGNKDIVSILFMPILE